MYLSSMTAIFKNEINLKQNHQVYNNAFSTLDRCFFRHHNNICVYVLPLLFSAPCVKLYLFSFVFIWRMIL